MLYARVNNSRNTPWRYRRLTDGDTASDVLAESLGLLNNFEFESLDSGFYDGKYLMLLHAHNFAYTVPIVEWGSKIKTERSTSYGEHECTDKFSVMIHCIY